MSHSKPGH